MNVNSLKSEEPALSKLRRQLALDARHAEEAADGECRMEWLCPERWAGYDGPAGRALYASFSDEELLEVLRSSAERLGRNPTQKEVFCVYRRFLRDRFGNWPRALAAAGLRPPAKAVEKAPGKGRDRSG